MFRVRFWNEADENIKVAGRFAFEFDAKEDAWYAANALLQCAHDLGAVAMDINNEFYPIEEN